jgi:pimeloyl-ACP methyl ester carboxylesterase
MKDTHPVVFFIIYSIFISLQLLPSCVAGFVLDPKNAILCGKNQPKQQLSSLLFSRNAPSPALRSNTTTPPSNIKILILPGFGNDAMDYMLEQAPIGSLVRSLQTRGWKNVTVLPIRRIDWIQVFWNGIFDIQFWQNRVTAIRPAFQWYLQRVVDTIQQLLVDTHEDEEATDDTRIILVCHSAGGWLARAALGYYGSRNSTSPETTTTLYTTSTDKRIDLSRICGLVTLGAPHDPPPPTVMDMTRGALRDTAQRFPGAFHNDQFFYMTVIGDAVRGIPRNKNKNNNPFEPTTVTGFAYDSYKVVCGEGETNGDGVVPIQSAHLDGAVQLNLPGIFHSINVPEQWYGSDTVIDQWHDEMMQQIRKREKYNGKRSSLGKSLFGNPFESIFARNLLNDGV